MAKKPKNRKNPFAFQPVILDQDVHTKRRVIKQLPTVHQTETLQKFFSATADHLFDPGKARDINGYIGNRPLWHNPEQDYYLAESSPDREFYQLDPAMVSRDTEGTPTNLLFYPDLVNHLRFQGGITNNHFRLFDQDTYTWCPPIDLDKVLNFRQYVWLPLNDLWSLDPENAMSIAVNGPTESFTADGEQFVFFLPGQTDDEASVSPADFYDLAVTKKSHVTVHVNGEEALFNYNGATGTSPGDDFLTFDTPPAAGSLVQIWVYSDVENTVLGHKTVSPLALAGVTLSNGMRIRLTMDKNTDYKASDIYIIEGVGDSIRLIPELVSPLADDEASLADYIVMARGAENDNPWSVRNRWFHISTLNNMLDDDYVFSRRAVRPVVEFDSDLELFNYGIVRRPHVDIFMDAIELDGEDLIAVVNTTPTSITLQDTVIAVDGTDNVSINGRTHGPGARVLITNSDDEVFNNKIFAIVNQLNAETAEQELAIVLETDGLDPDGAARIGQVIEVRFGANAGKEYNYDGSEWVGSQAKVRTNQAPLFMLYDMDSVALNDPLTYPVSNFLGSRLFSYQQNDDVELSPNDHILNLNVSHDNKGDILFENYLETQRYQYNTDTTAEPINGFYFHRKVRTTTLFEEFSNDWFKSSRPNKQYLVDRFEGKEGDRLFHISQEPEDGPDNLQVWRGRTDDAGNFARLLLVEHTEFVRRGRKLLVFNVQDNDIIEIKTFNSANPPEDAQGFYEIPSCLIANPDNETVITISKGDFYAHFSEIIASQEGFYGAEYAVNNYRDTSKDRTLGTHIVQHVAPLLKTMLLASDNRLDLTLATRFVEGEYNRFKDKFHQKVLSLSQAGTLRSQPDSVWIDAALTDINLGKTKTFPFYNSRVGMLNSASKANFIPATPSFVGAYPLYKPDIAKTTVTKDGEDQDFFYIRGHDGSWTLAYNQECARILLALENQIYDSVPQNIRLRERPAYDWQAYHGDGLRKSAYSYDEYLELLQPSFERWTASKGRNYRENTTVVANDVWTYNWSKAASFDGTVLPGHWRGIYKKYYGTARPDRSPWEMLGFVDQPDWWANRYGPGPYTSDNSILWSDLENGYIAGGPRKGTHSEWARPGLQQIVPVDETGSLKNPYDSGIATTLPLVQEAESEWEWGDNGPVEQDWRRSSSFAFACATAAYLMRPAMFVELGWDAENLVTLFPGEQREQWMDSLTMNRPRSSELKIHGEDGDTLEPISRVGIQQWISDLLASRTTDITTVFGNHVRGLGAQLAYKVGGFTGSDTLNISSDAFGRIPPEDVSVVLYRSPSIHEETYSGIAVEWTGEGFRVYGYDPIRPRFDIIPGDLTGAQISLGGSGRTDLTPAWRGGVYYSVNVTVHYGKKYYRCTKTHTSSSVFEVIYWQEVARPQYADSASILWLLDASKPETVQSVPYGTVVKTPQNVADLFNGYDRYLRSRGWIFDNTNDSDINDWQGAIKAFVSWTQNEDLAPGDVIALSPGSARLKFAAEHGTIQPVEQVINGAYSIVDQLGKPIDEADTSVVRFDSEMVVSSTNEAAAIYGLRLFISEVEHAVIFQNKTIFNDTIYNPLLSIQQPRLRIQGFRTIGWTGRIDAPGFIISGNSITPNFEKAADDFRRFFDIEAMEGKDLQDRARANLGYQEREYLNNLLLGPTNQFELYQGMIQQKGSPASMSRLLRSSFIQHNKGLKFFEEWAFRVGDYGGSETQIEMDFTVAQTDFKHNPQLFEFNCYLPGTEIDVNVPPGVSQVLDLVGDSGDVSSLDNRWVWRPDMVNITWPMRNVDSDTSRDLPTPGFVKLDEVRWIAPRLVDWGSLVFNQLGTEAQVQPNDRVWYYGLDDPDGVWKTAKYYDTGFLIDTTYMTLDDQGTVIALTDDKLIIEDGVGAIEEVTTDTDPNNFYLTIAPSYRTTGLNIDPEQVIFEGVTDDSGLNGRVFVPKFAGTVSFELGANAKHADLFGLFPAAGMYIKRVSVEVTETFDDESTLVVGTELYPEEFVSASTNSVQFPQLDTGDTVKVVVAPRDTYYVGDDDDGVEVDVVKTGLSDPCTATTATWSYKRPSDISFVVGGSLTFHKDEDADDSDFTYYHQKITVPIDSDDVQDIEIKIDTAISNQSSTTAVSVVRPAGGLPDYVDLTQVGTTEFLIDNPYEVVDDRGVLARALLTPTSNKGSLVVTLDYFYTSGFEILESQSGILAQVPTVGNQFGGSIFTWVPTVYDTADDGTIPEDLWDDGDIIEIKELTSDLGGNGGWAVMRFDTAEWQVIRVENRKVDSAILTSAAIYDHGHNELTMVLQVYDPMKGFIPGIADRELHYKLNSDPAVYGDFNLQNNTSIWGMEQVGRLWWDLSTVRYLDYEIYDDLSGGVDYRWKHWGQLAPGCNVDVYEWVRSPVKPVDWEDFVAKQKTRLGEKAAPQYTGTLLDPVHTAYVSRLEWNPKINRDEPIYYFWVLNVTALPKVAGRSITATQVANILSNPVANDFPYFAVIDHSKMILGGIKQFVADEDTILKVKWKDSPEVDTPHHKQWILLREQDERNTIEDSLWDKMRDSLVGWDTFSDAQGNPAPKQVPDPTLPHQQQVGNLIRPRQAWYPADDYLDGDYRPSRDARAVFVETINDILMRQPYTQVWFDWENVFRAVDPLPDESEYVTTALDLADLKLLIQPTINAVQPGERVLIQYTPQAQGFWTLWECLEDDDGRRDFKLVKFQKWGMQEGYIWNRADWFAPGWSPADFPVYRFEDLQTRDVARPTDYALLKGTLVQVDNNTGNDGNWTWYVFNAQGYNQVGCKDGTIQFKDAFYNSDRQRFGPAEAADLLTQDIRPDDLSSTVGAWLANRDGSLELEFLLNSLRTRLLDTLQKNELFFSMVKSAFKANTTVDWAFKTSFLYIGGYSEDLRQSPVAFKDQIDNVVAYLEEVKPYHVRIREYVRRLSYGPDIAKLAVIDFDKPVYIDRSGTAVISRRLDPDITTDDQILRSTYPWRYWRDNVVFNTNTNSWAFSNDVTDVQQWNAKWNPIRRLKTQLQIDRVACGTVRGWDTSPWDPSLTLYSQKNQNIQTLSELSFKYRNETLWDESTNSHYPNTDLTKLHSNFYFNGPNRFGDRVVDTYFDRDNLLRSGFVTLSNQGTIVIVRSDASRWMWTGRQWIGFDSTGWGEDARNGAASRIERYYNPLPGMIPQGTVSLIEGCDFNGTIISSKMQDGIWDMFEWDSTGWSSELKDRVGSDPDQIEDTTDDLEDSDILVQGNGFAQPGVSGRFAAEQMGFVGKDFLNITVKKKTNGTESPELRFTKTQIEGWQLQSLSDVNMQIINWDQAAKTLTVNANGLFPFYDPDNPTQEYMDKVKLMMGYYSTTSQDMTLGDKVFELRDTSGEVMTQLPRGLLGIGVKVVLENADYPEQRMIGAVADTPLGQETLAWQGSITVNVTGYVGDVPSDTSITVAKWNIIPLELYTPRGQIWVGQARFTYSTVTPGENAGEYILGDAMVSSESLAGVVVSSDHSTISLPDNQPIYDASMLQRIVR